MIRILLNGWIFLFFYFISYSQNNYHYLENHLTKELIIKHKIDSAFIIGNYEEIHLDYDTTGNLMVRHILTNEKDITHYLKYKDHRIHEVSIIDETDEYDIPLKHEKYIYEDNNLIEFQLVEKDSVFRRNKYFYVGNILTEIVYEGRVPNNSQKKRRTISIYNKNGLIDTLKTNTNLFIDYYLYEYENKKLIKKKGIDKDGNLDRFTTYNYDKKGLLKTVSEYELDRKEKFQEYRRMEFFYFNNDLLESVLYSDRVKKKMKPYKEIVMDYEFLK